MKITKIDIRRLRYVENGHVHYARRTGQRGRPTVPDRIAISMWGECHGTYPQSLQRTCDDPECVAVEHHRRVETSHHKHQAYVVSRVRHYRKHGLTDEVIAEVLGRARESVTRLRRRYGIK